jgi:hypothetical protein
VTPISVILAKGQSSIAASSLFSASDPDGDTITQYDFWNTGVGGGRFLINGAAQAINTAINVSAAQLSQVSYQPGAGGDTLWIQANDGYVWSAWSSAFTVSPHVDTPPVVSVSSLTAIHGESFAASSLFSATDFDGDTITQYDFWDTGTGGGHFALNGTAKAANQDIIVSAAQLALLSYQSGSGADTLWVKAYDGTQWSAWSAAFTVTAPVDSGPTVTSVLNRTTTAGQVFAASSLFSAADPFGDAIAQYDFWDTGGGGGHFALQSQALGANQDNFVSAAELAQTTYVAGTGTDTLWVRVQEGGQWSPWSPSFTISDPTTISAGATLELPSAYSGHLAFTADTGMLQLDDSGGFAGTVAGLAARDTIDLRDIAGGADAAIHYSGDMSGGTLAVTDGTHTANIMLLGQYASADFHLSSDHHGGTLIAAPLAAASSDLGLAPVLTGNRT